MHTDLVKVDPVQAAGLYRKYKEHVAYQAPIDWEIQRAYQLLAKGKTVIRAIESVKNAGLNRQFVPKLAITPATAKICYLRRYQDGAASMSNIHAWSDRKSDFKFRAGTFVFPHESFPIGWDHKTRADRSDHEATVPLIPVHLRPKRGLASYHILWEADWSRGVPVDPLLLRRIGYADLWLVVASWELTQVEVAALATRV
jgi:hypothetical protein